MCILSIHEGSSKKTSEIDEGNKAVNRPKPPLSTARSRPAKRKPTTDNIAAGQCIYTVFIFESCIYI